VVPDRRVAEELRDVDQDRVEEGFVLVGMDLEVVHVVAEAAAADLVHPAPHPALEA
jgi:hypothetical protein